MADFEIRITRDKAEVVAAQKLRFDIFNLEMKMGVDSSFQRGLDADDYDPLCEHLIVRDTKSGRVVGTYRLLPGSEALKDARFYSETHFNLENIKKLEGEVLELGRSCVHKDYRNRAVIDVMWQALADYMRSHHVRYVFGCPRLHTTDHREVSEFFALLRNRYYAPEEIRVRPLPGKSFADLSEKIEVQDPRALFLRLPSLIKGYLRFGALLCGPPALDLNFGTAYFFLLLDVRKMSSSYRRRFGFSGPRERRAVA